MLLLLRQLRPLCRPYLRPIRCSTYATVSNALPKSASPTAPRSLEPYISSALSSTQHRGPALPLLLDQYSDRAGHVLPMSLPYEHTPTTERRFAWEHHLRSTPRLVAITHCAQDERSGEHVVSLSSGFPIANLHAQNEIIIVTSADAFEEMRASPLLASPTLRSGSFALLPSLSETEPPEVLPLTGVASSLPLVGLVLFTARRPRRPLQPLPLSHIPAPAGTALACHSLHDLSLPHAGSSAPYRAFLPGLTSAFVHGAVRGYTDPRGREAEPGTYDALHRLLFSPHPSASLSRGGPLVDASTGAVVGVVGGARLNFDSTPLGWGVPAEAIFEMFELPGLEGKR